MQTIYLEQHAHIALCDLLKLAGIADSGGQAKALIAAGHVLRNGATETRKTAKIQDGETIAIGSQTVQVKAGFAPDKAA